MTDNEIIKALECCLNNGLTMENCPDCPYHQYRSACMDDMLADAISLINRQQKEIERLGSVYKAKIESVNLDVKDLIEQYRHEAIKEFAERLKADLCNIPRVDHGGHVYYLVGKEAIDNLVKEMVGE